MGNEADGKRLVGKKWVPGRALLETEELVFRGDARCKIPFHDIKTVRGTGSRLEVSTAAESYVFDLDADAAAWAHKIQNPKGRIEKLGIKPGMQVGLYCISDERFREELVAKGV